MNVELLGESEAIEHTAVAIGSHDPALDLLASELSRRSPPMRLASTNAGSYGGLVALRRGEAHLAGCHLLDPATGVYNETDVRRVLPGRAITLVHFAQREQGLILPKGNPRALGTLHDLTRPDVRFVNRQRGAGTRMLLDHLLAAEGIDASAEIEGYDREQYTHLAVAADVDSGMADAALGIRAAARALGTEFIPIGMERYDLVIPNEHLDYPPVAALLDILLRPGLRQSRPRHGRLRHDANGRGHGRIQRRRLSPDGSDRSAGRRSPPSFHRPSANTPPAGAAWACLRSRPHSPPSS